MWSWPPFFDIRTIHETHAAVTHAFVGKNAVSKPSPWGEGGCDEVADGWGVSPTAAQCWAFRFLIYPQRLYLDKSGRLHLISHLRWQLPPQGEALRTAVLSYKCVRYRSICFMYSMYVKKRGSTPHIGFLNNLDHCKWHSPSLPLCSREGVTAVTDEIEVPEWSMHSVCTDKTAGSISSVICFANATFP